MKADDPKPLATLADESPTPTHLSVWGRSSSDPLGYEDATNVATLWDRALGITDRFTPVGADRNDPALMLRVRLVTAFTVVVSFWVPLFALVCATWFGAPSTGAAILAFGPMILAAPWVMRGHGVTWGGNLLTGGVFSTILAIALLNGGLLIQVHLGLCMIPVLGASIGGLRSGAVWTGLAVLAVLGFVLLAHAGTPLPQDIDSSSLTWFRGLVAVAVPLVLLCFVAIYEYTRESALGVVREREEQLARIIDTAPDGLAVLNEEGRILRVNPAALRMFAARPEEVVGTNLDRWVERGGALRDGAEVADCPTHRVDGTTFLSDVAVGRLTHTGDARFVVLFRDVTVRHEAARALADARDRAIQANRAKSTFLANMSHELRTPLNAILGYAELIAEEAQSGEVAQIVQDTTRITTSGRHLLSLIDNVLDLSKIEAGKMALEISFVEIRPLLDELIGAVSPMADQRGNVVRVVAEGTLGGMNTDPLRLKQILLNLLSNAMKFTTNGEVVLRAERRWLDAQDGLRFVVSDTGIGMTREQCLKVFEDFVQGDASTTRRFGGTGLGLSISRRLARMLGGDLSVSSTPGIGSIFTLELPAQPPIHAMSTPPVGRSASRNNSSDPAS